MRFYREKREKARKGAKKMVPLQTVGLDLCGKKLVPLPIEFCDFERGERPTSFFRPTHAFLLLSHPNHLVNGFLHPP